jgi:hypothetical protein
MDTLNKMPDYFDNKMLKVIPPTVVSFKEPIMGTLSTGLSYPITIQTVVKDQDGNPLEGVHLYSVKNPTKGATSNSKGQVKLEGVEYDEVVTFSFVGSTKHIKAVNVTSTTTIEVGTDLPEVTVTAKKPSNALWWLLGLVVVGGIAYKANQAQKNKVVKVNL